MKCCSLQGVGRVAQEMRLDLLLAQAGDGLNITWTDVSVAGLLWLMASYIPWLSCSGACRR